MTCYTLTCFCTVKMYKKIYDRHQRIINFRQAEKRKKNQRLIKTLIIQGESRFFKYKSLQGKLYSKAFAGSLPFLTLVPLSTYFLLTTGILVDINHHTLNWTLASLKVRSIRQFFSLFRHQIYFLK